MSSHHQPGLGIEHPYSHQIMIGSAVFFFLTWILDTFFLQLFIDLRKSIPLIFRIVIFTITLVLAFILMNSSQKKIFSESQTEPGLVSDGIYALVRHPLYLSIPLLYMAFSLLSVSILSFFSILFIFIFFDRMVVFEEKELVNILGDVYREYTQLTPRWIPRFSNLYQLIFASRDD